MKRPFLTLLFIAASGFAYGQNPKYDIELSQKWANDHSSVDINAKKHKPGSYTVFLRFGTLENVQHSRTFRTVVKSDGRMLTLKSVNKDKPMNYNYHYWYAPGYKHPKLDSTFVYRLPYSTAKTNVKALHLYNLSERHFDSRPARGWKSFEFLLEEGDTVFAARKGLVVSVTDGHDVLDAELQASYHSVTNNIRIEHEDGTLADYMVFEKGSISVKEGDLVYPGTPLGKAGAFSAGGNHTIRFHVFFPDLNPDYKEGDSDQSLFEWVYYNPHFATAEGNRQLEHESEHRAVSPSELIQKEMTKKEIKSVAIL